MRVLAKEACWVPTCSPRGWPCTGRPPCSWSTAATPTTVSALLRDWTFSRRRPSKGGRHQGGRIMLTQTVLQHVDPGVLINELSVVACLLRYDNRCRHLREQQVEEKLAQGLPHVIRFRLEAGAEPFQDLVFGWTQHEVAQVRSMMTSMNEKKCNYRI